jgi:LemA protein
LTASVEASQAALASELESRAKLQQQLAVASEGAAATAKETEAREKTAAAENEREILVGVTEARGGIRHYTDSVGNLVAEQSAKVKSATTPAELQQSDVMLMNTYRGFRGFMTENYPTVQSTQNFSNLQTQLEGTENRINTERNRYNEAVKNYNAHIRGTFKKMGLSLVASEEDNFKVREMFEAKEGAEEAPQVKF